MDPGVHRVVLDHISKPDNIIGKTDDQLRADLQGLLGTATSEQLQWMVKACHLMMECTQEQQQAAGRLCCLDNLLQNTYVVPWPGSRAELAPVTKEEADNLMAAWAVPDPSYMEAQWYSGVEE